MFSKRLATEPMKRLDRKDVTATSLENMDRGYLEDFGISRKFALFNLLPGTFERNRDTVDS